MWCKIINEVSRAAFSFDGLFRSLIGADQIYVFTQIKKLTTLSENSNIFMYSVPDVIAIIVY